MDRRNRKFLEPLEVNDKLLKHNTKPYIFQKHYLLKAIEDVNIEMIKNNVGFIIDVSKSLTNHLHYKIINHYNITNNNPEMIYKDILQTNLLIKRHTHDKKLVQEI